MSFVFRGSRGDIESGFSVFIPERRAVRMHAGARPINTNSMAFLLTVLLLFMILNSHQMSPNFLLWLVLGVFLLATGLRMYATCQQLQAQAQAHVAAASGLLGHTEFRLHVPPSIAFATRGRLQSLRLQHALLDREFDDLDYDALRALDGDNNPDAPSMSEEEINALPVHKYKGQSQSGGPSLQQPSSSSASASERCRGFSNLPMFSLASRMSFLLWCTVLSLQCFFIGSLSHNHGLGIQLLNVGEELWGQTLPLKMGQGIYNVRGLKESRWYEVKISYPASIPASFSLQLESSASKLWLSKNRRLLNTEKLIFKYDSQKLNPGHNEMYVLVAVEPDGVVAQPGVQEREYVIFNIVCDELSFGIPYKAWWVGIAAILCLILASVLPYFLPLQRLLKIQTSQSSYSTEMKAS